ncbi:MAG TPA: hypothetical protein VE010_16825 [Thermoanaerobaculia bacterium]|nr:hypothetical protein [Thermoanaerobaculia bacterium]
MEKYSLAAPGYETTFEKAIAAAILGELLPELQYAAPVLLERSDRGDALVATTSPTDLGFETGSVDSVLLEFFRALVPYVNTVLAWGVLNAIQTWLVSDRESRQQAELVAGVNALIAQNAALRQTFETIAELLARRHGVPISTNDVAEAIADAACRGFETDGTRTRD